MRADNLLNKTVVIVARLHLMKVAASHCEGTHALADLHRRERKRQDGKV